MHKHVACLFVVVGLAAGFAVAAMARGRVEPPVHAQRYTLDTPLEVIAADPAGAAMLDKDVPGLLQHPAYAAFKSMALNDLEPFSEGKITDETLAAIGKDLRGLPGR